MYATKTGIPAIAPSLKLKLDFKFEEFASIASERSMISAPSTL